MAKMIEEVVIIKLSKLVKDSEDIENISDSQLLVAIEEVAQELAGANVLVEVEKA